MVRITQGQEIVDDVEHAFAELVSNDVLEVVDDRKAITQGGREEDVQAYHRNQSRQHNVTKFKPL